MAEVRVTSPFPFNATPRIWCWMQEFMHRVADDFGPKTREQFVGRWNDLQAESWAVWRDEELGGAITFEPWSPVAGTAHCIFKRSFWGPATTEPALREVAKQIFAKGYEKILCLPFSDNATILSLCKRIGFKREGTLKNQTKRGGQLVDLAVIGLTRESFEEALNASSSIDSGVVGRRGSVGRGPGEPGQENHPDAEHPKHDTVPDSGAPEAA